jgi:gold/copper resistance efflux system membrane fusion protein
MVLAASVVVQDYTPRSTYTARLTAVDTVDLKPRVSGYISQVSVPEGQIVQRGQTLFRLDPEPFAARLAAARAATREAEARLGLARAEDGRARQLVAEGVAARERTDVATAALREREAQVASARAAERLAALDLGYASVEAPIAGRVGRILVTRGNLVAGGETATPLTSIVSVDPLYVEFDVDEATYLRSLADRRNQSTQAKVGVRLEDGSTRSARLNFIGNGLDRATGTIRARAVLPNPDGRLAPGLFAEVDVATDNARPALLISDLAIGVEQGRRFVLVIGAKNMTEYRPVTLGPVVGGLRVIEKGLKPGDRVVVKGLAGPGMAVQPKVVPMPRGNGVQPEAAR